jgi:hypothetical protein
MHIRISVQYGNSVVSQRMVFIYLFRIYCSEVLAITYRVTNCSDNQFTTLTLLLFMWVLVKHMEVSAVKISTIYKKTLPLLGEDRVVYEWIERFKNGRTSIRHEEGARHVWLLPRRPSDVTRHCSHTALISFCAFRHLVHLQPIKKGSLPSALFWCKWKVDLPNLWHKSHNINRLPRSRLHHYSRRQVDHTYRIMPNQQCNQLHKMRLHCW